MALSRVSGISVMTTVLMDTGTVKHASSKVMSSHVTSIASLLSHGSLLACVMSVLVAAGMIVWSLSVDSVGVVGWRSCSARVGGFCRFGARPLAILSGTTLAGANMGMTSAAYGTCTTPIAPVRLATIALCACLSPTAPMVDPTPTPLEYRPCPIDISMSRKNVWSSFCGGGSTCVL